LQRKLLLSTDASREASITVALLLPTCDPYRPGATHVIKLEREARLQLHLPFDI
jgi:hypothetical protein